MNLCPGSSLGHQRPVLWLGYMHVDSTVLLDKDRPLSCISYGIVALLSVWGEALCDPEMQL